jgi:hypothetical protein
MSLQTSIPTDAEKGKQYVIRVCQKDTKGKMVGGATVIYYVE